MSRSMLLDDEVLVFGSVPIAKNLKVSHGAIETDGVDVGATPLIVREKKLALEPTTDLQTPPYFDNL